MDPAGPVTWKSTANSHHPSSSLSGIHTDGNMSSLAVLNDPIPMAFPLAGPPRVLA
jgi:hypothetical protein